jgi:hypothetical protein
MGLTTKSIYGARITVKNPNTGFQEELAYEFTTEDERDTFYHNANLQTDIINSGMYTRRVYTAQHAALEQFKLDKVRGIN